jgi:hypothetical protein
MVGALTRIFQDFTPAEMFMSDGGRHFDNNEVHNLCNNWGTTTHVILAYSPWVNGLVEGTNKILLHVLKQLCAPDLREENYDSGKTDDALKKLA